MKVFSVSMLVLYLCLGVTSAYFGFAARETSNTREYHVLLVREICIYPDSPAQTTGLLAGLILLVAQILVIATCACTCRWNDKKQVQGLNASMVGLGCVLGCSAAGLSAAFFASGSALSRPSERYRVRHRTNSSADCAQPRFTIAISLMFVAIFWGVVFFIGIIQGARKGVLTTPLPHQITPVQDPATGPVNPRRDREPSTPPPGPDQLPV